MKTKTWVLTTLVLFIAAISNATEIPIMNIVSTNDENALVTFSAPSAFPIEVSICRENGETVYYWKSEKPQNQLAQFFNLSEIGNGKFNVCLNYGGQSITREVQITKNEMKVGPPVKLYEPFFKYENELLKVSFLNVAHKNVYLNVFKDGEHVTGLKLGNNMDIQKCLNFSKLGKGDYEVILTDYFKEHSCLVQK